VLYRAIVNNGTWGISALSRMTGVNFDALTERGRRRLDALPAMIYHGVRTEAAVLIADELCTTKRSGKTRRALSIDRKG
jgi:DNA-binding sugar fermentation-stimulating protein